MVTAGVCSKRLRRPRSSSPWRCLKPYSANTMGEGSTTITPASPSMMTQSSWRTNWLDKRAPTTAGISRLRATMAVCEVLPPKSVTKPANTLCLNCSMSAGDRSCATRIRGTSTVSSSSRSCCESLRVVRLDDTVDVPLILVAHDLSPADMLQFKQSVFAGFVTDFGGKTSHTAIVARSLDIPAVVGARLASQLVRQDDWVIIDGDAG